MHMIEKEILGSNRWEHPTKERIGCRGILIKASQILLIHGLDSDFYIVPGGGQEAPESMEACCIREFQEEAGFLVQPCRNGAFLQIHEYYEEHHYVNYYYTCEITGTAATNLTEVEVVRRLVPEWVNLEHALDIFSHYQEFAFSYEMKMRSYLRDYTALLTYQQNI